MGAQINFNAQAHIAQTKFLIGKMQAQIAQEKNKIGNAQRLKKIDKAQIE